MNARTAQWLAAGLGFVLIVLVGAVIFILLSRPAQGPRVSPTPTLVAVVSPSASPSPILTPSLFPTLSLPPTASLPPTPTAVITPLITPPITPPVTPTLPPPPTAPPTPSPTPTPTIAPTPTLPPTATPPPIPIAAARQLRVMDMGLDARAVTGVERYILFSTDGPSVIRATISGATGRSRVCLWRGTDVAHRQCETMRDDTLERAVFDTGTVGWTLTLIGANETTAPTVDLTLDFNAAAPAVEFRNLRYQGTPVPNYNGVQAGVDTLGPGTLQIDGAFDLGQEHQYHVVISEISAAGVAVVRDETGGPANTFTVTHEVEPTVPPAQPSYIVSVTNPNPVEEPLPIFLHARLSWP